MKKFKKESDPEKKEKLEKMIKLMVRKSIFGVSELLNVIEIFNYLDAALILNVLGLVLKCLCLMSTPTLSLLPLAILIE